VGVDVVSGGVGRLDGKGGESPWLKVLLRVGKPQVDANSVVTYNVPCARQFGRSVVNKILQLVDVEWCGNLGVGQITRDGARYPYLVDG